MKNEKGLMLKRLTAIILLLAAMALFCSYHVRLESWYQRLWCAAQSGKAEVRFDDGTRCDCLTKTHAVEFDFAPKWAEAIGQSLHYSQKSGRRAGIVLIMERPIDSKYVNILLQTIHKHKLSIDVWTMQAPEDSASL